MLALNKTIAYTKDWKSTIKIAFILALFIVILLIFLGPFGTATDDFSYKNLKLSGYALCVFLPIIGVHFLENRVYKIQNNRWYILNELGYVALVFLIIISLSFLYHFLVISQQTELTSSNLFNFIRYYGVPFAPILIPIWLYFRSKFGTIEILEKKTVRSQYITIQGDNKSESLKILDSDFIFAQAQQNYVVINYKVENDIEQKMIRSTLSNLTKQLPNAWQVHRSYLVNLDFLKSVEGNARKRQLSLSVINEPIPVSQKYYDALKKKLANSSQNLQK